MTGVVGTAVSLPGGGALCVAVPLDVAGVSDFCSWFWPHAANNAVAPAVPTPSSASRRSASRRDSRPSTWSVAISSAMYRWMGVIPASMPRCGRRRNPLPGQVAARISACQRTQ
ncbi:hypothetical protein M4D79_08560 [Mycolicibacterium novocastrense]|nr:hypothetical protein M4D79_08560 [Mycolicibacterium novocastrense]